MVGPAFQLLHQLAHGKVWRKQYENMYIVGRHMTFVYLLLILLADERISDLALWAMSPGKVFFPYLVIQTKCYWIEKNYGNIGDSCSCPQPTKETLKPTPEGVVFNTSEYDNKPIKLAKEMLNRFLIINFLIDNIYVYISFKI